MYLHIIKRYLILADQGFFPQFTCENEEHGRLYSNLDLEDRIYLYCLFCNFKNYLGLNTIQDIVHKVMEYEINSDLRHLAGLE